MTDQQKTEAGQTMVERVARAIRSATTGFPDDPQSSITGDGADGVGLYTDVARAAIEAMREPTEAVMRASRITIEIPKPCEGGRITTWGSNVWPQMIDAALAEPTSSQAEVMK